MHEFITALGRPMAIVGLIGQACFFSRFLVQWIVSERQGKSTVPVLFWYLSIVGGSLVLVYAVWLKEPVFTLGQSVGLIVYVRNLWLIRKEKRRLKVNGSSGSVV